MGQSRMNIIETYIKRLDKSVSNHEEKQIYYLMLEEIRQMNSRINQLEQDIEELTAVDPKERGE